MTEPAPTETTERATDTDTAARATESGAAPKGEGAADPDLAILTVAVVDVDTRLAALCGIPDTKVYFKFDSAKVRPDAKEMLDELATCAKSGAAKGKGLRVIGRTDPRGTERYNDQLGAQRAEAVARHLRDAGVADARVETESKGEAQADPEAPGGWPYARRVTVRLAEDATIPPT